MPYVATINTPGYLPDSDEPPPTFDTASEAWLYLAEERKRDELAWVPDDLDDPEGPAHLDRTTLVLEARARGEAPGTTYGPTPGSGDEWGEDGGLLAHDLGLAYSVEWVEEEEA